MQKWKSATSLAAVSLVALAMAGCGSSSAQASHAGEPTLTITEGVIGGKTPAENVAFGQAIGKALHCHVDLINFASDYDEKLIAMLASGQKLDVIYTGGPTLAELAANGEVTNLQGRIQHSKVLGNPKVVPDWEWDDIKLSSPHDRGIYGVPVKYQGALMPIIREDWLKQLGLSQPTTLPEFYHVFQVFKQKKHAYGLTLSSLYNISPFMSAVGVKMGYSEHDGKLNIPYATTAAIPVYAWLHKLYAHGLLDPNFVTNTTADERDEFLTGKVGMFVYWDAWVPELNGLAASEGNTTFNAQALPGAVSPSGKPLVEKGTVSVFAIPSNAPDKSLAFKFLEWWNTQPGEVLGSLGVAKIDYTMHDGKYQLTKTGQLENMDHGDPEPISSYWKNPFPQLQKGYANARSIGMKYGYEPLINANWDNAQDIVWQYGDDAILGTLTPTQAVSEMHQTLLRDHYISP